IDLSDLSVRDVSEASSPLQSGIVPVDTPNCSGELASPVCSPMGLAPEEKLIEQLARQEGLSLFDLYKRALLRLHLIGLAEGKSVLLFTMHHIISDGWSLGVLMRDLSRYYQAARQRTVHGQGQAPSLPALPIQYVDYAHWQREWLQGEVLQKQLDYW